MYPHFLSTRTFGGGCRPTQLHHAWELRSLLGSFSSRDVQWRPISGSRAFSGQLGAFTEGPASIHHPEEVDPTVPNSSDRDGLSEELAFLRFELLFFTGEPLSEGTVTLELEKPA